MDDNSSFEEIARMEHPRLVRLCAVLTSSPGVAEDLAQEVLLEAWRARAGLHDPRGVSAWLSAIARNVCLRWRRTQGRGAYRLSTSGSALSLDDVEVGSGMDLEIEVERHDLTDLLDRALGQLSPEARTVLSQRYAEDLPVREMAVRQGISDGAISLRLHRGRQALKRVLTTDLRVEADAFGLLEGLTGEWQETRIWCSSCGQGKLRVQSDPASTSFAAQCTRCSVQWSDHTAGYLQEVKGPWRTLLRMHREAHRYFRDALREGGASCVCCGGHAIIALSLPPDVRGRGVHLRCEMCDAISYQPSIGLVLTLPEIEAFWREHRRIRLVREYEVEHGGRSSVVTSLECASGGATLDVVSDGATFEVLEVHTKLPKERDET